MLHARCGKSDLVPAYPVIDSSRSSYGSEANPGTFLIFFPPCGGGEYPYPSEIPGRKRCQVA